jgi:putative glutamine amidotransferase
MKKNIFQSVFLFGLILCVGAALSLAAEAQERYFDTASPKSDEVRLTIFEAPEEGIQALLGLKKEGFLNLDKLVIVSVFHKKERADYLKAAEFVKANRLDWIKFHELSGEISRETLFQKNSLSSDFENIFKKSDGVIFFGGYDIPPAIYGQKTGLLTQIRTPYRHYIELSFVFHLLGGLQDPNLEPFLKKMPLFPVLGICLGSQTLNVGTGGTLYQDVWADIYNATSFEDIAAIPRENLHRNPLARLFPELNLFPSNMHPIRLLKNGIFVARMNFKEKDTPYVRCGHHQAINALGRGMKVAAASMDGKVVEAIEHEQFANVLGVQFHPEKPELWDKDAKFQFTPEDKEKISLRSILDNNPPSYDFHKRLFTWFFQNVEKFHKTKDKMTTMSASRQDPFFLLK